MRSTEEVKSVKKHVISLMLKYIDLFSVARMTKRYTEQNITDNKDWEFFLLESLKNNIGLDYVVNQKLRELDTFWNTATSEEDFNFLKAACVKSILIVYIDRDFIGQNAKTFYKITQDELRWC